MDEKMKKYFKKMFETFSIIVILFVIAASLLLFLPFPTITDWIYKKSKLFYY